MLAQHGTVIDTGSNTFITQKELAKVLATLVQLFTEENAKIDSIASTDTGSSAGSEFEDYEVDNLKLLANYDAYDYWEHESGNRRVECRKFGPMVTMSVWYYEPDGITHRKPFVTIPREYRPTEDIIFFSDSASTEDDTTLGMEIGFRAEWRIRRGVLSSQHEAGIDGTESFGTITYFTEEF
jgi:hypothetical protein